MWERYQKLCTAKDVETAYLELESVALEYVFSEKLTDALVMAGDFDWVDLGSFKDLHEISVHDDDGNHIVGENVALEDTTNSYIRQESDVPVAVIGLDNVVVINSKNGVLVTNKNFAQKVGDVAKRLQS